LLRPQRSQEDIPYHFKIGRPCPCDRIGRPCPCDRIFGQKFTAFNFFFLEKIKKNLETTLIQIPMAHLKITFWQKKLTGCLSYRPQKGTFWTISALEHSKVCTLFDFGHLQFTKISFKILKFSNRPTRLIPKQSTLALHLTIGVVRQKLSFFVFMQNGS
jgi:hypothetical protein